MNKLTTVFICLFLMLAIVSSGCEPLRKKFTRQKKKDKEISQEFVPILEPEEYPAKVHTPQELYSRHYSLWQAWQKELTDSLVNNQNRKRQLYLFDQVIKELEEMQKYVGEEMQSGLSGVLNDLKKVYADMQLAVPLANASSWQRDIESISKKIRQTYAFNKIKDDLKE